jgi:hypothetical protein
MKLSGVDDCNAIESAHTSMFFTCLPFPLLIQLAVVPLDQLDDMFVRSLQRAQQLINVDFQKIANRYRNSIIEQLPLRRYYISQAKIDLTVGTTKKKELVMPLTPDIQGIVPSQLIKPSVDICLRIPGGCRKQSSVIVS